MQAKIGDGSIGSRGRRAPSAFADNACAKAAERVEIGYPQGQNRLDKAGVPKSKRRALSKGEFALELFPIQNTVVKAQD